MTYQITDTDYSSQTDPAIDPFLLVTVSPGGPIVDGHYRAQVYGLNVTLTPIPRLYFSGMFTYNRSRVDTASNGNPSVTPYRGNIYVFTTTATFALNAKTDLQASYIFSRADYDQANAVAGGPLGLDFTRHQLILGLKREFSKHMSGTLRYEFSRYNEPSSSSMNNFVAHGIFATIAYKWP